MNIVDTSGWLEYFADTSQARHFAAAIEDTGALLVPSIVLYEVFKKILLAFDEDKAVALYAGRISIEKKLPMADALIYATAILHRATVYTQDAHFQGLPQTRVFAKAG